MVRVDVVCDQLHPGSRDGVVVLLRVLFVGGDLLDPSGDLVGRCGHVVAADRQEGEVDVLAAPEAPSGPTMSSRIAASSGSMTPPA